MGRAGIEPATLGLKVPLDELQRTATNGNALQTARIIVATNCSETQRAETSLYARCTPNALPLEAKTDVVHDVPRFGRFGSACVLWRGLGDLLLTPAPGSGSQIVGTRESTQRRPGHRRGIPLSESTL
jgi:hypothetical protein